MGVTKTEHFTDVQNEMAIKLKALAHPARIAIMEHLCQVNSCICGAIVDALPLAQPTISQHLRELKNAGLIKGTIEGTAICYCIDEKGMAQLQTYFNQFAARLEDKNQCC
jgi:DNA-binding transcriptional ArsR family regulator